MSQENIAIVRSICAEWERGDYGSVAWAHHLGRAGGHG